MATSKKKYFPVKSTTRDGFKEPVSWLGGRELIASLKSMLIYGLYGESIDPRPWMKGNVFPPTADADSAAPNFETAVRTCWQEENSKQWDWKRTNFARWQQILDEHPEIYDGSKETFWFDYIADSGDGQTGVFGVGCMCLSDLWLAEDNIGADVEFQPRDFTDVDPERLLPRGNFLFVGGDTAYHVADYEAIHERFQVPFRWAFASVRKYMVKIYGAKPSLPRYFALGSDLRLAWTEGPTGEKAFDPNWDGTLSARSEDDKEFVFWDVEPLRPLFGLPANHDYYDDLDGFNRQFRRPPYKDVVENRRTKDNKDAVPLKIPTFRREQEASYTALRMPFGWSVFGIDSENQKLDFRQRAFFKQIFDSWKPRKVIIATPEPTTVFGRKCDPKDKTAVYTAAITKPMGIEQPFLNNGEITLLKKPQKPVEDKYCRLDLSGDVHHYSRYWGAEKEEDPTQPASYASVVAGGGGAFFDSTATLVGKNGSKRGEIAPEAVFPSGDESNTRIASKITNLWNIQKGGYVQIAGGIMAAIIASGYFFVKPIGELFTYGDAKKILDPTDIYSMLITLVSLGLFLAAGLSLNSLNALLKDGRYDPDLAPKVVKIKKLRLPFTYFLLGGAIYLVLFLKPNVFGSGTLSTEINKFLLDALLLLHFIMAGIVFWVSNQYLTWVTEHFKLVRQEGRKPENWINLFVDQAPTANGNVTTPARHPGIIRRIVDHIGKESVDTIPVFVINILGVIIVAATFSVFKDRPLSEVAANICFALVAAGGFIGIIYFAVSTGGHYHRGVNKYAGFGSLGVIHAVAQIFTPIVLLACGDWRLLLGIFVLTVFMNGLSGSGQLLKFVVRDIETAETGWKQALWKLAAWRMAEKVMGSKNAWVMLSVWCFYVALILASPFLWKLLSFNTQTLYSVITAQAEFIPGTYSAWTFRILVLIVAYYVGYRFSCIWFSWYLCVTSLFNGHNNEAGGAARIEGFKHILRVKVEPEKLTVYVIGFDNEEIELEDLRPKLVDKFVLETSVPLSPIPKPIPQP